MQTLEEQINQRYIFNSSYKGQWLFEYRGLQPIEKWTWGVHDELRVRATWLRDLNLSKQEQQLLLKIVPDTEGYKNIVDKLILKATLAEALTSPSEYIRARRQLDQALKSTRSST